MHTDYLSRLLTCTEDSIPDLDEVVMGALTYLGGLTLPTFDPEKHVRPLVVGSGNAVPVGEILFSHTDAVCIEESSLAAHLARGVHDAVYVISASGMKHAVEVVQTAAKSGLPVYLITTNQESGAAKLLSHDQVIVFPRIREPYTYNTSTYLGMLLGMERTSPLRIQEFIEDHIDGLLPQFADYRAFLISVPPEFQALRGMFETKFHELFGPHILGTVCTTEEVKHAKTVITAADQCFISFGETVSYGNPGFRLTVPLPHEVSHGELMALGYYIIGKIQGAHHPYFKEHIGSYVQEAGRIFGHPLSVIVE
jgi:hypothetical protein